MALKKEELTEIDALLTDPPDDGDVFAQLRRRFPHLALTRCDASDVTEAPFRTYAQVDMHLLDTTDHCARITADPARASGFVLAKRKVVA